MKIREPELMNVVQVVDQTHRNCSAVWCGWCFDWIADGVANLAGANDIKIDHENDHGIYLDPDTGALYHDPEDSYI